MRRKLAPSKPLGMALGERILQCTVGQTLGDRFFECYEGLPVFTFDSASPIAFVCA